MDVHFTLVPFTTIKSSAGFGNYPFVTRSAGCSYRTNPATFVRGKGGSYGPSTSEDCDGSWGPSGPLPGTPNLRLRDTLNPKQGIVETRTDNFPLQEFSVFSHLHVFISFVTTFFLILSPEQAGL